MSNNKGKIIMIVCGAIIGIVAITMTVLGNPKNMGFCIACFIRDTAGAVQLHQAPPVQYIRPEIIGLVLGALIISLITKEFKPRGGSSPVTRFVIGFFIMIGALVFLGCPFRMILRLAGGDLNAIVGLVGFVAGIGIGIFFLNKGFSLKRTYQLAALEGMGISGIQIAFLVLLLAAPPFIIFSSEGPGSMHAPIIISLAAGLLVGVLAQRSRLCMVGGIRDIILFKDWNLILGFMSVLIFALIGNLILNATLGDYFKLGFDLQPIAHTDGLWNFLGMTLVGFGSVLAGGCPLRQLVMAGEGNADSTVTIIGLFVGAAFAHNFQLASAAQTITDGVETGGPTIGGKIAVVVGFAVLLAIAGYNTISQNKTDSIIEKGAV